MITPSSEAFLRDCAKGGISPLFMEINVTLSPWEGFRRIRSGNNSFLLESVRPGGKIARYSFAGTDPYMIVQCGKDATEIVHNGHRTEVHGNPLEKIRELVAFPGLRRPEGLPPFIGGAVGFLGYEFARHFERLPGKADDDLKLPEACFMMVDTLLAWDHATGRQWVIGVPGCGLDHGKLLRAGEQELESLYSETARRMRETASRLDKAPCDIAGDGHRNPETPRAHPVTTSNLTKEQYEEMVSRCKEYIAAGDIYQANLSQRLSADLGDVDPLDLYSLLREINPSPFAAFLEFDGLTIVSSSPERLLKVEHGMAETRPIAGTRPRGADRPGDDAMSAELMTSPKERAEHIMLVDLERNDLGRVCEPGTVEVNELMALEEYSHVIHIVSNVRGKLKKGADCFDVLRAGFPGGTITGVPKVRCMEIIDELEPVTRGPYTGSIGYFSFTGDMDTNIIIRTFVIKDCTAYVQVGAGIVADSDPEREYMETLHKAEALLKTLERV